MQILGGLDQALMLTLRKAAGREVVMVKVDLKSADRMEPGP